MLPDRVSNPGPLTYESGALWIALRGLAVKKVYLPREFTDIMVQALISLAWVCTSLLPFQGLFTMRIHRHYGAGSDQSGLGLHFIIGIPIAPSINVLPILIFCEKFLFTEN